MKRIESHTPLILREAFNNKKAFLTFTCSLNASSMCTHYTSAWRYSLFAVILVLNIFPFTTIAQKENAFLDFEYYLNRAQEESFAVETRKKFINISRTFLNNIPEDSIKYSKISKIVEVTAPLKDSVLFHTIATEGLVLAQTLNHPLLLGDAHWNYGSYYLRENKFELSYYHYNSAFKYYTEANSHYYAGKMLYNMAFIARQSNDFTGAEILLFRSIKIFESTNNNKQLYRCYNLLGNNADDLEEYKESLNFYNEAALLIPQLENAPYYQLENLNNLGVRFYKMEEFNKAIAVFDKALADEHILNREKSLHAKLLDNKAYCQISLNNYETVESSLKYAMALRDSIEDTSGSVMSRLRLALYYGKVHDTLNAIFYAKEGLKLGREHYLNSNVLYGLELLAALDRANTNIYLEEYITLNKRLIARDRQLRNKFTAIQYETDKYVQENERLFRQRIWILLGAILITVILILVYINTRHRAKNKELLFEREQQQYNEDMFLMALGQKTNLEKGKKEERQRISQELHDDIVSRLFTLRFRWQRVILAGESDIETLQQQFLERLGNLETDIRNLSHDLREMVFFQEEGFLGILENIGIEKSEVGKFQFHYHYKEPEVWERLPYSTQIHLRRLFEEVLHNIVKHAQASMVTALLYRDMDMLHIHINDNGNGFNPIKNKKGIGIKSLETRIQKLNGKLDIHSHSGNGTSVMIHFPTNTSLQ